MMTNLHDPVLAQMQQLEKELMNEEDEIWRAIAEDIDAYENPVYCETTAQISGIAGAAKMHSK